MVNRRHWVLKGATSDRLIRAAAGVYIALALCMSCGIAALFVMTDFNAVQRPHSFFASLLTYAPIILALFLILGAGLICLLIRNCRLCRMGPGKRIATALEKMSKGDLGWKITLRRGDGLAEVASSVSQASESLADRVNKISIQVRQLTEIENFLIDSLETEQIYNPYTMKALRKLKICTSRLNANIDEFHLSSMPTGKRVTVSRAEPEKEKTEKEELSKA